MSKYIIIPVEELTVKAKNLRQASVPEYHAIANSYDKLIKDSKQISFDEKDIEEKAKEHAENILKFHSTTLEGYKLRGKNSYQQALLDIKMNYYEKLAHLDSYNWYFYFY